MANADETWFCRAFNPSINMAIGVYQDVGAMHSDLNSGLPGYYFATIEDDSGATWVFVSTAGYGPDDLEPLKDFGFVIDRAGLASVPRSTESSTPTTRASQSTAARETVPGMHSNVTVGQPCSDAIRYVYGQDGAGRVFVCHVISGGQQMIWDGPLGGDLVGVRKPGSPCPYTYGAAGPFAQTQSGRPMICTEVGWTIGP
ncbi:hypothetical protein GCM10010409_31100 [Mycolicibacterium diernhoferi]